MPTVNQWGAFQVFDITGHLLAPGTLVNVLKSDLTMASLYTDLTGSVSAANPVTIDALSNLLFFTPPGSIFIQAILSGIPQTPVSEVVNASSFGSTAQLTGTGSAPALAAGGDIGILTGPSPITPTIGNNLAFLAKFVTGSNPLRGGVMVIATWASGPLATIPAAVHAIGADSLGNAAKAIPYVTGADITAGTVSIRMANPPSNTPMEVLCEVLG